MGAISDLFGGLLAPLAESYAPGTGGAVKGAADMIMGKWDIGKGNNKSTSGGTTGTYKEVTTSVPQPQPALQTPSFWVSGKPNMNAAYGPIGLPLTKANFPNGGPLPGYSAYVPDKLVTESVFVPGGSGSEYGNVGSGMNELTWYPRSLAELFDENITIVDVGIILTASWGLYKGYRYVTGR